jgi:hypothetical protein
VPREYAERVAVFAHAILKKDKQARRRMYEILGLEPDQTIR